MFSLSRLWALLPVRVAAYVLGGLVVLGLVYGALEPDGKTTRTKTEAKRKTETREVAELRRKAAERQRIIDDLQTKQAERSSSQANKTLRTTERIERYAPGSTPSGAPASPIVTVRDGVGQPASVLPGQPFEIIVRTSEEVDTGREERSVDSETSRKTDVDVARTEETDASKRTDTKTEESSKSETVTKTGSSDRDKPAKLGFGFQAGAKGGPGIAVKYDLARVNAPPIFGLKGAFAAAGVGVEKKGLDSEFTFKKLDVTPYVGIGKGKVSIDLGYRIIQKEPVIGLNYRTTFR